MKHLFLILLLLGLSHATLAQDKYYTKKGSVVFEASVPSFEEVKAESKSTTAILNTANAEFAALVLVKSFRFKNALMEEHFNENYAESDAFPKATFKGKIQGFSLDRLKTTIQEFLFSGSLTFHGQTKILEDQKLSIRLDANQNIILEGDFSVDVASFDIEIPKVIRNKLSKTVNVHYNFNLGKK